MVVPFDTRQCMAACVATAANAHILGPSESIRPLVAPTLLAVRRVPCISTRCPPPVILAEDRVSMNAAGSNAITKSALYEGDSSTEFCMVEVRTFGRKEAGIGRGWW